MVFEPRFYEGLADMLKEDELPIFNWVWFGLYRSAGGLNGYTYGMDVFGKEELEVSVSYTHLHTGMTLTVPFAMC